MSEMQTGVETPEQTYQRQQQEAKERWRVVAQVREQTQRKLSLLPACPSCGEHVWYVDSDVAMCNRCQRGHGLAWNGTTWQS